MTHGLSRELGSGVDWLGLGVMLGSSWKSDRRRPRWWWVLLRLGVDVAACERVDGWMERGPVTPRWSTMHAF